MKKESEMIKIGEACRYLGVCRDTLRKWEKNGVLVPIRIGQRRDRRYNIKTLDQFFLKPQPLCQK